MSIGVGDALRQAREQAGVRLADAAAETRIRESHLMALEDEEFGRIGGDVYVKGFLRSYARHLGLDPEPLIGTYQQHFQSDDDGAAVASRPIESPPPPRRPITTIVVVLAILVVGGLALVGILVPDGEGEEDDGVVAPDPVGEEEDPGESDDSGQVADPDEQEDDPEDPGGEDPPESQEGPGEYDHGADDGSEDPGEDDEPDEGSDAPDLSEEVVLTLSVPTGETWARVTVDGQAVDEALFQSGYTETYTGEEILVRIGAPQNAELEVNGETLGQLGPSGVPVDVSCSTASGDCQVG